MGNRKKPARKGWVAEWEERKRREAETRRRKHVQSYGAGVVGFCPHCFVALKEKDGGGKWWLTMCPHCSKRVGFVDREDDQVRIVDATGKMHSTDNLNWRRMSVAGEEWYFKTVEGQLVKLSSFEALSRGVVVGPVEPKGREFTSVQTTWVTSSSMPRRTADKPYEAPEREPRKLGKVARTAEIKTIGEHLSEEAQRLFEVSDARGSMRATEMRKRHVAKAKSNGSKNGKR